MPVFPCSITMVDAYGRAINKRVDISAADYATALTQAASFIDDLQAISEAEVLYYQLSTRVTYVGALTAGANRDEGVTFSVRTTDNEKANVKVPAPKNAIFQADGSVDLDNALVVALFAHYLGGLVLVDDGEIVTSLISGRLDK